MGTAKRSATPYSLVALACPVILAIVVVLLRAGAFRFHDDFTGLKAVGFFFTSGLVLLGVGMVAAGVALYIDRASWLTRLAASVSGLLLLAFAAMLLHFLF